MTAVASTPPLLDLEAARDLRVAIERMHDGYSANDPGGNQARLLAAVTAMDRVSATIDTIREQLADETTEHVQTRMRLQALESRIQPTPQADGSSG